MLLLEKHVYGVVMGDLTGLCVWICAACVLCVLDAREEGSSSPFAQFQACQLLQFSALLRWEEMAPGENMAVRSYLAEYLLNRLARSVDVA